MSYVFINRDPIGGNGGINLYEYVRNNPINAVDPLGEDSAGLNYEATFFFYVAGGQASMQVVWDSCQNKWCATVKLSLLAGKGKGTGKAAGIYGGAGAGFAGASTASPITPGVTNSWSTAFGGGDLLAATASVNPSLNPHAQDPTSVINGLNGTVSVNAGAGGFASGRYSKSFTACSESKWSAIEDASDMALAWVISKF